MEINFQLVGLSLLVVAILFILRYIAIKQHEPQNKTV
jgi:hypothetical protein